VKRTGGTAGAFHGLRSLPFFTVPAFIFSVPHASRSPTIPSPSISSIPPTPPTGPGSAPAIAGAATLAGARPQAGPCRRPPVAGSGAHAVQRPGTAGILRHTARGSEQRLCSRPAAASSSASVRSRPTTPVNLPSFGLPVVVTRSPPHRFFQPCNPARLRLPAQPPHRARGPGAHSSTKLTNSGRARCAALVCASVLCAHRRPDRLRPAPELEMAENPGFAFDGSTGWSSNGRLPTSTTAISSCCRSAREPRARRAFPPAAEQGLFTTDFTPMSAPSGATATPGRSSPTHDRAGPGASRAWTLTYEFGAVRKRWFSCRTPAGAQPRAETSAVSSGTGPSLSSRASAPWYKRPARARS